ncbi:MAG: hypothetical protein EAZ55_04400 [Cytophagales bacterium]|nr:MAG: hypothetical protein EAZ55_04400 [Cytophagales bacterium]
MKNFFALLYTIITVLSLGYFFFFGFNNYNQSDLKKLKDRNEGNINIYGIKGQPARQTLNKYTNTTESGKVAEEIRTKFFRGKGLPETTNPSTADTTSTKKETKDETKKEEVKKDEKKSA